MCDSGIELCFFNSKVFFLTNSVDSENCQIKRKTRNTTSSEQFRIHEKQKLPHRQNSSKIVKNKKTKNKKQTPHQQNSSKIMKKKHHTGRTAPNIIDRCRKRQNQ